MDLRRAAPKPAPDPTPCSGAPCGQVFNEQQRLDEVTCPCGYGYYDKLQHVFVPGSLVRGGQAVSRKEYEAHVRRCPDQEEGAPVLAIIGANSKEAGAVVYLGATGGSSQPQRTANPYSSGRHGSTAAIARSREGVRPPELEPREQKTASRAQGVSIFISEERVEKEVLQFYIQLLNVESANSFEVRQAIQERKPGWMVTGSGSSKLSLDALKDLVKDTGDWRRETVSKRPGVSYERSKTAAARRRNGVAFCDDNEQHLKASSTALPQRPYPDEADRRGDLGRHLLRTRSDDDSSDDGDHESDAYTPDRDVIPRDTAGRHNRHDSGLAIDRTAKQRRSETSTFPARHDTGRGKSESASKSSRLTDYAVR